MVSYSCIEWNLAILSNPTMIADFQLPPASKNRTALNIDV